MLKIAAELRVRPTRHSCQRILLKLALRARPGTRRAEGRGGRERRQAPEAPAALSQVRMRRFPASPKSSWPNTQSAACTCTYVHAAQEKPLRLWPSKPWRWRSSRRAAGLRQNSLLESLETAQDSMQLKWFREDRDAAYQRPEADRGCCRWGLEGRRPSSWHRLVQCGICSAQVSRGLGPGLGLSGVLRE